MYSFDDYELDTKRFQLRRGGEVVRLEPKVFDVLRYLVEHHERVATKRELLDALWPGEVVTEAVLPTNINALRRALGQQRGAKMPIETVHGRGYRFSARVELQGEPAAGRTSAVAERAPDSSIIALSDIEREPFIGRKAAMAQLLGGLEGVLGGDGQLWVVTGDSGIGKSRTAAQLATVALSRGATVWSGQCLDAEAAPAFWPWVQVLREALRGEQSSAMVDYLGSGLADIVELLPEMASLSDAHLSQSTLGDEQARFRLFDAVARFLTRAGEARPRVVVLEDLHWADPPSLHLLKFVACTVPSSALLLVVTAREEDLAYDPELRVFVDALERLRGVHRMRLEGFRDIEIARYVEALTGVVPAERVVQAIERRTGGNPLFVREMVKLSEGQATVAGDDVEAWELALPPAAADAVRARLTRLPGTVLQLLEVASVIGVQWELSLLEKLLGIGSEPLLEAIDIALSHGLVLARSDRISTYAFTHGLIRDALYGGLSLAQRARVHVRVVEALEDRRPVAGSDAVFGLAHHAYHGLPGVDATKAVAYTRRAAQVSEAVHGWEQAADWYRRCLDALPFLDAANPELQCRLELSLARALQAVGGYQEARRILLVVADRAAEQGWEWALVESAIALSPTDQLRAPVDPEAQDVLHDAIARVGESAPADRARLQARLSHTSADPAARVKLAAQALQTARASGDASAQIDALTAQVAALHHPSSLEAALAASEELLSLAADARRSDAQLEAYALRFLVYVQLGDLSAADAQNAELLYAAKETRDVLHTWHAERHQAMRAVCDGDFARADGMLRELAPVGAELHGRFAPLYQDGALYWLMRERGELEAASRARRQRLVPGFAQAGGAFRAAGLLFALDLGQLASARRGFEELASDDFKRVLGGADQVAALVHLGEVCVTLADRPRAELLYGALSPYYELNAVDALGHYTGSAAHTLGRLGHSLGRAVEARAHLEHALDANASLGMPPALARTRFALASVLSTTGRTRDLERAAELRRIAQRDAEALGMRALAAEMRA